MIKIFYLLILLFSCSKNEYLTEKKYSDSKLKGIYSSAGSLDENVVSQNNVKGILIRVAWKDLEPTPNTYNWNLIDNQLSLINQYQKEWSLSVLAGSMSPSWLYDDLDIDYMNLTFREELVRVPHIFDNELQERFKLLVDNVSERYKNNNLLKLVYLPQMTLNGVEGHFNGISNSKMLEEGFDENLWIEYSLNNLYYLKDKFYNKKVAIELHEILNSDVVAVNIAEDIINNNYQENVGLAIWWLSGKESYQSKILDVFKYFNENNGEIFAQLIGNSSTPERFYLNDFKEAFYQAEELGIHYIEVWNYDVVRNEWDEIFNYFYNYLN